MSPPTAGKRQVRVLVATTTLPLKSSCNQLGMFIVCLLFSFCLCPARVTRHQTALALDDRHQYDLLPAAQVDQIEHQQQREQQQQQQDAADGLASELVQYDLYRSNHNVEQSRQVSQLISPAAPVGVSAAGQWSFSGDLAADQAAEQREGSRILHFNRVPAQQQQANNGDEQSQLSNPNQNSFRHELAIEAQQRRHRAPAAGSLMLLQQQQRQQEEQQEFMGELEDEPTHQMSQSGDRQQQEQVGASDYLEQHQQRGERALSALPEGDKQKDEAAASTNGGDGSMSNEPQTSGSLAATTSGSGSSTRDNNATGAQADEANHTQSHKEELDGKEAKREESSMDTLLAHFIRSHLMPAGTSSPPPDGSAEQKQRADWQDKLANDFSKLYRVLRVTNKWARFLRPSASGSEDSSGDSGSKPAAGGELLARNSSVSVGDNSISLANIDQQQRTAESRSQAAAEPEAEAAPQQVATARSWGGSMRRRQGSNLLVGRLAKKTDWNALFVKLAKVFLQYFLDLMLNDMFGTTGEFLWRFHLAICLWFPFGLSIKPFALRLRSELEN